MCVHTADQPARKHSANSESLQYIHIPHLSKGERLGSVTHLLGQKGEFVLWPNTKAFNPTIHLPSILLCAYSVPSRGPRPPSHPEFLLGAVRRAENFRFPGCGVPTLPSRKTQRQRDEPQQQPGFPRSPGGLRRSCFSTPQPEGALQRRELGPPLRRAPL